MVTNKCRNFTKHCNAKLSQLTIDLPLFQANTKYLLLLHLWIRNQEKFGKLASCFVLLICSLTFSRSPPFVFTPSKRQEFAVLRQSTSLTEVSFFFFFANDFSNFEKDSITLFGLRDICLCQSSCKYKRGQNTTALAPTYTVGCLPTFSKPLHKEENVQNYTDNLWIQKKNAK